MAPGCHVHAPSHRGPARTAWPIFEDRYGGCFCKSLFSSASGHRRGPMLGMLTNATTEPIAVSRLYRLRQGEANTDVVGEHHRNPDTTGTWANDATMSQSGCIFQITLMAGATYQTAGVNAWTDGTANLFSRRHYPVQFYGHQRQMCSDLTFDAGMYPERGAVISGRQEHTTPICWRCMRYYPEDTTGEARLPNRRFYGYGWMSRSSVSRICYPVPGCGLLQVRTSAAPGRPSMVLRFSRQLPGSNNASYSIFVASNVTGRVSHSSSPANSGRIGFSASDDGRLSTHHQPWCGASRCR